jgi:hypothetical protein
MILGKMLDVVVWEAKIGGPGLVCPANTASRLETLLQALFWTFGVTTYHPTKFHFLF